MKTTNQSDINKNTIEKNELFNEDDMDLVK